MSLNLGELSGIISLDERPAMTALNRARQGMRDTADEGQRSTDRLSAQQQKYAAAVENASANVSRARQRERDAADAVRVSEIRLADARRSGADGSAAVVAAENRVNAAHGRARAAQDSTARSTRDLEMAQARLADTSDTTSARVGSSFSSMGNSGNRAGRNAAKGLALITGGLTGIIPAAGASGAALIAMAGSALTLGGSIKSLLGVAGLAPAALFAVGTGAGVLVSAFSGMGEALKTASEQTTQSAGSAQLDAMTLADAARGVAQAERAAADQRADAAKRVSDAQNNASRTQQDAAERVASAEKKAADDRAAAARRISDAQQDLTDVVERNAEQQAAALQRVASAERSVESANRRVEDSQRDLNDARVEAVARVEDLQFALVNATFGERQAALDFEDAQKAWDAALASGADVNSREMRGLNLEFERARFQLIEAKELTEERAAEEKAAREAGIKGNRRVIDAEQAVADAREAASDAVKARAEAVAEVAKVERENATRVVKAQEAIADATREAASVQVESAASVRQAVEDGADAQADAADAVADAVADAAKAQRDSVESVADAHRNLERVQLQQAEAAIALTEKSVDAMNKLSPSAQLAAVALLDVYQRLGQVQDLIQEDFFTGFADPLYELADVVFPQLLTKSGNTIAGALGRGMQQIMRSLASGLDDGVLADMLGDVADTFEVLNGAIDPVIQSIITLTDVGMEYMPRLAGGIRDAATEFDAFLQQAEADGSLRAWIDDGITGTQDLFSIFGSVLGILDQLEDAARAGGIATTLGSVADGLDRIEATAGGEVFQSTLSTIFAGAKGGADGLLAALGPIGEALEAGGPALAEFLRLGGEIAGAFIGSMATALSDPNFGSGLVSFMEDIQAGVDDMGPKLPDLFDALGGILENIGPTLEEFGPTAVDVLIKFAEGVESILDEVEPLMTDLAGSPWAVGLFLGVIGAAATLSTIATFTTSINGVATAFRLMWAAASGPVGWIVGGIAIVAAAFTYWLTETETGQKLVEESGVKLYETWQDISWGYENIIKPAMVTAVGEVATAFSDFTTDTGTYAATVMTNTERLAIWWATQFASMKTSSTQSMVDIASGALTMKGDLDARMVEVAGVLALVPGYFETAKAGANTQLVGLATDALTMKSNVDSRMVELAGVMALVPGYFQGAKDGANGYLVDLAANALSAKDSIDGYMVDLGSIMANVPGYFDGAMSGAMSAWALMQEEAKKPVRFVIDKIINEGLIRTFNLIPGVEMDPLAMPASLAAASSPAPSPAVPTGQRGPTRYFAKGGFAAPGWAVVGEEGPELVNFSEPGRVYTAKQSAAMVHEAGGAATAGQGNMGGFFEGNAANIRRHGAYYLDVAPGMGDWNFPGAAGLWDGAAGVKVKVGRGSLQGRATPLERGGGILGYTMGNNIDMSPSWMRQLGPTQRRTVAAHEMGHAMGLPHNSMNSIMQPNLGQMASTPTSIDIRNLQHLFPGGSGQAGEGSGEVSNPFDGIVTKLMEEFRKNAGDGMFVDAAGGLANTGLGLVTKWVSDIKDNIGDIAGDVVGSIRDFFGGGAAMATPTLMDGGGWLHDTDGPTVVHRTKKPDAFTPNDEWQGMKKDYANAMSNSGVLEGNLYLDSGEFLGKVRGEVRREIGNADAATRYQRRGV